MGISTVDSHYLFSFRKKKQANVLTMTYKTPRDLAAITVCPHLHRVYSTLGTRPLRLSSISRGPPASALCTCCSICQQCFSPRYLHGRLPHFLSVFLKIYLLSEPFPGQRVYNVNFPLLLLLPVLSLIFLFSTYFY